jgi:hypothetical protein
VATSWSDRIESLAARTVPAWVWEKWYRFGMRVANRCGDRFVTHHTRPKFARDVGTWSDPVVAAEPFAVVMQGPVAADGFTLETLRTYARLMPHARRILSTWDDADPKLLDPIRGAGVEVVLSPKPPDPGTLNVNLQIVSAGAGVRRAVECGAEWVLKTRTDQRLYAPNVPEFLVSLARAFPVAPGFQQRYRVIGLGKGSQKFLPYCLSDQTVFGHAGDMLLFWTPHPRSDSHPPGYRDVYRDICRYHAPEAYLTSQFLRRLGRAIDWSLRDSWAAFADHFCVADVGTTDLFWPKYARASEYDRRYDAIESNQELDFREWLILYTARANKQWHTEYDRVMELSHRVPLATPVELSQPGA